jgi:FKBP-type peptidyl-prolyl cis-trans isomerase FkpA
MSATQVPIRPVARATRLRLAFGLVLLVLAGAALAFVGAGQMRPELTRSGVQIRTVQAGSGELITANDGVIIDYVGTLPDGTVFDSNQNAPLLVQQVVPGFAEALQNMQEGGRYKVRIPAELAYGATPPPGSPIPPNSPLDFEITVNKVARGVATQVLGQPGPGAGAEALPPGVNPQQLPPAPGQGR